MAVNVVPMPVWVRDLPESLRPCHPPVFDGEQTSGDIKLAEALIDALDPESRR